MTKYLASHMQSHEMFDESIYKSTMQNSCFDNLYDIILDRCRNKRALCFHDITALLHDQQGHLAVRGPGFISVSPDIVMRSISRYLFLFFQYKSHVGGYANISYALYLLQLSPMCLCISGSTRICMITTTEINM